MLHRNDSVLCRYLRTWKGQKMNLSQRVLWMSILSTVGGSIRAEQALESYVLITNTSATCTVKPPSLSLCLINLH